MKKKRKIDYRLILMILLILVILCFFLSFNFGRYSGISSLNIFKILMNKLIPGLFNKSWTLTDEVVVTSYRFPRILAAILVGAALPMAGATYQSIFSNPMASPDTLGVTNGASLGAVIAIILNFTSFAIEVSAFTVGCLAVLFVYVVSLSISKGRNMTVYLILVGMVISSLLSSFISILKSTCDTEQKLPEITYWLMGSFSSVTQKDVFIYLIFFLIGATPLFFLRWRMNLLTLSDIEVKSMGENINVIRTITILCATLLTASSIAITGGIGWVGLIIPHIARQVVGNDFRKVLPTSALMGALFLLIMDNIARSIMINEIPIGVLTALIGAPIFFFVLVKNRRSMLNDN